MPIPMENIGIIGTSFQDAGIESLARFVLPKDLRQQHLQQLTAELGVQELVYLDTCNRVEIAFLGWPNLSIAEFRHRVFKALTNQAPEPGEGAQHFKVWRGEGAVEHLFLMTSGLKSAQIGEGEIRDQVSQALRVSLQASVCGPFLERIFREALKVSKRVQGVVINCGGVRSIATLAAVHVQNKIAQTPGTVALLGVSPMTRKCFHILKRQNVPLLVVNRTREKAEELVAGTNARAISLAEFIAKPEPVVALVAATSGDSAILDVSTLQRLAEQAKGSKRPLVVDLGVPPNILPEDTASVGIPRIGMAEIVEEVEMQRMERLIELAPARELIDEALDELIKEFSERQIGPVIGTLQNRYRQTAQTAITWLQKTKLTNLDEKEQQELADWGDILARQLAHIPSVGLKALAAKFGVPAVRTFIEASGSDLQTAIDALDKDEAEQLESINRDVK